MFKSVCGSENAYAYPDPEKNIVRILGDTDRVHVPGGIGCLKSKSLALPDAKLKKNGDFIAQK